MQNYTKIYNNFWFTEIKVLYYVVYNLIEFYMIAKLELVAIDVEELLYSL